MSPTPFFVSPRVEILVGRHRTRAFATLVALCMLVAGCGGQSNAPMPVPAPGRPTAASQADARDQWLLAAFDRDEWGSGEAAGALGRPQVRTATARPNEFVEGQVDSIVVTRFTRGVTLTHYKVASGPSFLIEIEATAAGQFGSEIDVGTSWSTVLQRFGEPQGWLDGEPFYVCGRGCGPRAEDQAIFSVDDDRVVRIRIAFYWD